MRGHKRELLKSDLQNRKQRVKTNGVFSEFQTVNAGVPQGATRHYSWSIFIYFICQ